jgi:phosphoribosylformylglycinamidine (FGAM) synthase PurS component
VSRRTVAIALKIPDNAAYTALTTLRRLGIDVAIVERSDVVHVDAASDEAAAAAVRDDESLFNPNKHRLTVLEGNAPRAGEVWIEQDDGSRIVGWRLFHGPEQPASRELLETACERLLCNPAVERATVHR